MTRVSWTTEKNVILRDEYTLRGGACAAAALGCSIGAVREQVRKIGARHLGYPAAPEGVGLMEASKRLGYDRSVIQRAVGEIGLAVKRWRRNWLLTEEQLQAIADRIGSTFHNKGRGTGGWPETPWRERLERSVRTGKRASLSPRQAAQVLEATSS